MENAFSLNQITIAEKRTTKLDPLYSYYICMWLVLLARLALIVPYISTLNFSKMIRDVKNKKVELTELVDLIRFVTDSDIRY